MSYAHTDRHDPGMSHLIIGAMPCLVCRYQDVSANNAMSVYVTANNVMMLLLSACCPNESALREKENKKKSLRR